MPSVPIDKPSLTPTVLKRRPTRPDAVTPSLICSVSRSVCMLQVLPSYHMLQMPTCGFFRSASVRPTPYSIACDAPWLRGCVTRLEYLFMADLAGSKEQDPAYVACSGGPVSLAPPLHARATL